VRINDVDQINTRIWKRKIVPMCFAWWIYDRSGIAHLRFRC